VGFAEIVSGVLAVKFTAPLVALSEKIPAFGEDAEALNATEDALLPVVIVKVCETACVDPVMAAGRNPHRRNRGQWLSFRFGCPARP